MKYNYKCVVSKNGKRYYKNTNGKWKRITNKIGENAQKGKKKYKMDTPPPKRSSRLRGEPATNIATLSILSEEERNKQVGELLDILGFSNYQRTPDEETDSVRSAEEGDSKYTSNLHCGLFPFEPVDINDDIKRNCARGRILLDEYMSDPIPEKYTKARDYLLKCRDVLRWQIVERRKQLKKPLHTKREIERRIATREKRGLKTHRDKEKLEKLEVEIGKHPEMLDICITAKNDTEKALDYLRKTLYPLFSTEKNRFL